MMRRLILGCGAIGEAAVRSIATWPGELYVVDDNEARVESLQGRGVTAIQGDPAGTDQYPDYVDVVIVAHTDPATNRAAATAASNRYPGASLIAYTGTDPAGSDSIAAPTGTTVDGESLEEITDRIVDPSQVLAERVLSVATGTATKTHRLLRVLRNVEGPLAVLAHDNPDPDAIASAVGLCGIAERAGLSAEACYFGEISHQENRALVNVLELELRNLKEPAAIEEYGSIALVDHSRPGDNDQLPPETPIDVVIDHHPPRGPVEARVVELRPEVGSTSTLISDHLTRLGVVPEATIAEALLYGIRTDTKEFTREVSIADFEAAASLIERADTERLARIESPSVSADVLELIASAIENRSVRGRTLTTCVGPVSDQDALAQAADQLLNMVGIDTTLVYGFRDGTVYASGRARGADLDLGETLRDAFDQIGSAGGHANMAGAQIPLGILADADKADTEALTAIVREVVGNRFYEALADAPTAPVEDVELTYERPHEPTEKGEGPSNGDASTGDASTDVSEE